MSAAAPSTTQRRQETEPRAVAEAPLPHDTATEPSVPQARWRDPKRHAWLLGLVVPTLPFITWGLVEATGLGALWFFGPVLVFGIFPLLDLAIGMDARNPPDGVIKWLEQDRYYRWCTYLYLPVQYAGLVLACWLFAKPSLSVADKIGLALTVGMVSGIAINTAHELGHKRASTRALAEPGGARAERLRPLLHRAQPRSPRARRHARGPGELAARRELLPVSAANRDRQPALRLGARAHPARTTPELVRGRPATTSSAPGR